MDETTPKTPNTLCSVYVSIQRTFTDLSDETTAKIERLFHEFIAHAHSQLISTWWRSSDDMESYAIRRSTPHEWHITYKRRIYLQPPTENPIDSVATLFAEKATNIATWFRKVVDKQVPCPAGRPCPAIGEDSTVVKIVAVQGPVPTSIEEEPSGVTLFLDAITHVPANRRP